MPTGEHADDGAAPRGDDPGPKTAEFEARIASLEQSVSELSRESAERWSLLEAARERVRVASLELEQTQAALWQMAVLFTHAATPIVITDPSGRISDLNPEAERRYGVKRGDLLGEPLEQLAPRRCRSAVRALVARCRAGERIRGAGGLFWQPGDLGSARTTLAPMRDPRGLVVGMALAEDIRELKEAGAFLEDINQELRQLALVDSLTQLANRRHFVQRLEQEVDRAARSGDEVSLIMIDVDAFKDYNDALGHQAGDACLTKVGQAIAACMHRAADFVARYGGEEFAAILPGTASDGARWLAEKIRQRVEALRAPHPASPVGAFVTISAGVGTARIRPGFPPALLVETADRALYLAKRSGRNRVRVLVAGGPGDLAGEGRAGEGRGASAEHGP